MPADAHEAELAARARAGDREAFAQLCERQRRQVLRIATRAGADADAAEDIAQNSFVAALTAIGALRDPERFAPWLAAIARNQALMWRRGESRVAASHRDAGAVEDDARHGVTRPRDTLDIPRHGVTRLRDTLDTPRHGVTRLRDTLDTPRHGVTRLRERPRERPRDTLHLALALDQAISHLPPRHAAALHLRYWQGLTTEEIAAQAGVAQGTVKRWLHEARRAIRQEMIRMGAAPEGAPREKLAVVIVRSEDWEHLEALREALARADCEVAVNADPIPDNACVVVLDYEVEGGKGVEWLVYLRQTRADLPVMLLGPATQRTMYAAWAAGAEAYLTVPVNVEEFVVMVGRVVEAGKQ